MPNTEPLKSPIDDDGQRALRLMAVALSDIQLVGHTETSRELPIDLIAERHSIRGPRLRCVRRLAEAVLRCSTRIDPDTGAQRERTRELESLIEEERSWLAVDLHREMPVGNGRHLDPRPLDEHEPTPEALLALSGIVMEVGIEELGVEAALNTVRLGTAELWWSPTSVDEGFAILLKRLNDRLDAAAELDLGCRLERLASDWWFDVWSADDALGTAFGRATRKAEHRNIERALPAVGTTVLRAFLDSPAAGDIGPRQRALADALLHSVPSAFVVEQRDGLDASVRDVMDDERYAIHENAGRLRFEVGETILGRLIPLGDGRWMRSPGALLVPGPTAHKADILRSCLSGFRQELRAGIATEAFISTISRKSVPRHVSPASSARHAHELLTHAAYVLKLRGLARDVDASELDEREQQTGNVHLVAVQDEVGRVWLRALAEQVQAG